MLRIVLTLSPCAVNSSGDAHKDSAAMQHTAQEAKQKRIAIWVLLNELQH
jgi:hypothetical protein